MHALVAGELWTTDAVLAREPVGAVRSSETFPMPMRGLLRVAGSLIIAAGASGACKSEGAGPRERPTALAFLTQPALTEVDSAIAPPVRVAIHDQAGVLDTTAAPAVTIALEANPDSGTLSGTMTVNAVAGIATFHDLRIDRPANGYTLVARGSNLLLSTSNPFRVKRTFTALSSSGEYSCAVSQGGKTYCWGNNVGGQPGDSTGIQRVRPVLVRRVRLTTVDAGTENTCGISTDSIAYCWGANANGELGDGTGQQWFAPVTVAGGTGFFK